MATSTLTAITIVGIIAIAVLIWILRRQLTADELQTIMTKRKSGAKLVGRGEFVEGMEHIPVALALNDSKFYYENSDLEAYLDLERIDEVEYDTELATGHRTNGKVLRIRSHGQAFEFLLEPAQANQWMAALPPHKMGESAQVH